MSSLNLSITSPSLDEQLIIAAQTNNEELVKELLQQSANATYNNSDALQWAARNGNLNMVVVLLEAGADPKADNNNAINWAKYEADMYRGIVEVLSVASTKDDNENWMKNFNNVISNGYFTFINYVSDETNNDSDVQWLREQAKKEKSNSLSKEQINLLNKELPNWRGLTDQWLINYYEQLRFYLNNGRLMKYTEKPGGYYTNGYWLESQKDYMIYNELTEEQRKLIQTLTGYKNFKI